MHTPRILDKKRVIWDGATTSNTIDIEGGECFSIYLPTAFTGATLNVETWEEIDGTWVELYEDSGGTGIVAIGVTADKRNVLPAGSLFAGLKKIRFKSDQSETCEGELKLYI